MTDFWQTISATLVGGAITLFATMLTNRHQWRLESNRRLLEKIETAHALTIKIEYSYRMQCANDLASLVSGKYRDNQYINERVPFEELEMLVKFYTPELTREFDELLFSAREDYGKLVARIVSASNMTEQEREKMIPQVDRQRKTIAEKIENLQAGLVNAGRKVVIN